MDNDYLSLIGVLLGGFIGFMSAYGIERNRHRNKKEEHEKRIKRLAILLYEEIKQAAKLLTSDIKPPATTPLGIALGESSPLFPCWEATIEEIRRNRIVFDAHVNEIIDLPDYLPNQLVRFHNRLQTHCNKMIAAIKAKDIHELGNIRNKVLDEAENVKCNLQDFIKTNKKH